MNFSQKDNETFINVGKDLLNACPHHGYKT